jgi:hypothetical protein
MCLFEFSNLLSVVSYQTVFEGDKKNEIIPIVKELG